LHSIISHFRCSGHHCRYLRGPDSDAGAVAVCRRRHGQPPREPGGGGGNARALTTDLAKAGYDYVEVVFHKDGRYYRASGFKGQNFTIALPAGTYGPGNAVAFVGRESDHTLLAVGVMTTPNDGIITAATTSVTFILEALTADVTMRNTLTGADTDIGEILDYAAYQYQDASVAGRNEYSFYRLDDDRPYTLKYKIQTRHGALVHFQNTSTSGWLTQWGLLPDNLGTGSPAQLIGLDMPIDQGSTPTLASVHGKLPIEFTTPVTSPNGGWVGLKFSVPVSALAADTAATGGDLWYIRGGLANDYLDAGGGTSGGGFLFAIGNPRGLTTTIRGRVKSDYDTSIITAGLTLTLYKDGGGTFDRVVSINSTDGSFIIEGISADLVNGYQLKVTGAAPANHTSTLPESAVFKMAPGQQKTVDLEFEKIWKVSTVTADNVFNQAQGLAAAGDFLYICDVNDRKIKTVRIKGTGTPIGTVADFAGSGANTSVNDVGTLASFMSPTDIVAVGDSLYVADGNSNMVRHIDTRTAAVNTFASGQSIVAITATGNGDLYGANGSSVIKITGPGMSSVVTNGIFSSAYGITVDSTDSFYYVVRTGGGIVRANSENNSVSVWISSGISNPGDIVIDHEDRFLYVADCSPNLIKKVEIATGTVTTIAGSGSGTTSDGFGTSAGISRPIGITMDADGDLYVTQLTGNKCVRKLSRNWN
jgi:hypothetical protein